MQALCFWFKLGWISFGGTAAHIAIMHKDLVEKKRWISNTSADVTSVTDAMYSGPLGNCHLGQLPTQVRLRFSISS